MPWIDLWLEFSLQLQSSRAANPQSPHQEVMIFCWVTIDLRPGGKSLLEGGLLWRKTTGWARVTLARTFPTIYSTQLERRTKYILTNRLTVSSEPAAISRMPQTLTENRHNDHDYAKNNHLHLVVLQESLFTISSPSTMPPLERASSTGSSQSLNDGGSHHSASSLDEEVQSAKRSCFGSLLAVLAFLVKHGVSPSTIDEMNRNLENNKYLIVLQRSQEYCSGLWDQESRPLLLTCWLAMERYAQLSYKQTYRRYHSQRNCCKSSEMQLILSRQVKLAEVCTLCQKEVILAKRKRQ